MDESKKCVQACLEEYEELMEVHLSTSTIQEFNLCHKQAKSLINSQLRYKWVEMAGEAEMPPTLPDEVSTAMDQSFVLLKREYERKLLQHRKETVDQQIKQKALEHYDMKMETYLEAKNFAPSTSKDVLVTHTNSLMDATKIAKQSEGVSAVTVTELKDIMTNKYALTKARVEMSKKSTEDPVIGIDLGTTMCCVTIFRKGKIEVIPNKSQGNFKTTPSYIAFLPNGADTFGHDAKEESYLYPETSIYDAKRMIGRSWNDPNIQNDRKHWPFEVVNDRGHPKVKTLGRTRYPHEISARILAQFRLMADDYLELPLGSVRKAVITVPAYFAESQRRATAEAGECAGLDVMSILSEPTAAAIAYSWERRDKGQKRKALIYDLGGGTFDVAVATVDYNNVEILGVDGDTHLGGQDFDQLLMNYCLQEFLAKEGVDLMTCLTTPEKPVGSSLQTLMALIRPTETSSASETPSRGAVRSAMARLKRQCEKVKEKLSSSRNQRIYIERIYEEKDMVVEITKDKFEELITPLVLKTLDIVDRALADVKTEKENIDDIILVGGSTRVPLISKMLSLHFGGKRLCKSIDPDQAVAYGAGIQAAILNISGNSQAN